MVPGDGIKYLQRYPLLILLLRVLVAHPLIDAAGALVTVPMPYSIR